MSIGGKRGSSRRKGDEFQDLIALRIALEYYIARKPFNMYLEYEQSGNLDDIVVFDGNTILAHQVKYAVHPLSIYVTEDFVDTDSPVYIKKFADSWNLIRQKYPLHHLKVLLCSNRSLNVELVNCVEPDGSFMHAFIENRMRGNAKKLRTTLQTASGLNGEQFSSFLSDFQFLARQPNIIELKQYIRMALLDKELGLSDDTIFFDLMDAIKDFAIFSRQAITIETIDGLIERLQSKLLIPQVFPINQNHYVEQRSLSQKLDQALLHTNGGYIVVTGFPGSGKSTSLTTYFKKIVSDKYEVLSYYCFVSVHDNAQRIRAQADSLRANLLNEMHRRYPEILHRRHDYSERNFYECLKTIATFFVDQGRRFIIFLDGLDHAERLEPETRDTVISAIPADIPEGMTIVVGTQELHKWPHFLKRARERPESYIQMPLFSFIETEEYLVNKRGLIELASSDIVEIYRKSEGLPLYLNYVSELLIGSDSITDAISSLSPASGGDIYKYYDLLWEEFERVGMANAKHLCAVMASLRFSVHRDELYRITNLVRPVFEDSFKISVHLLRNTDGRLAIFHNSFREFVIDQLADDWLKEIQTNVSTFLKEIKHSPRWFGHMFKYCYEIGDYTYILVEVNADFVDGALLFCRPGVEILDALNWAIEAAYRLQDIVQLSRLSILKSRTVERLEHNLNRPLLAESLLAQGREQDVMSFAYSAETDHWLVERTTSLAVMYRLAITNRWELGQKLFDVFMNEFHGTESTTSDQEKIEVIGIARCLAIYSKKQARAVRWLSFFDFKPQILEQKDLYPPGYAPHLAAYIDTLVQFSMTTKLDSIKRVRKLFPKQLVQYYIIRSFARHNRIKELIDAFAEYGDLVVSHGNVELAYYAAKAGMEIEIVKGIAGTIQAPKLACPEHISTNDPILLQYLYSFIVVAYEGEERAFQSLVATVGESATLWNVVLRHLLKAGSSIAMSMKGRENDWFKTACESIAALVKAKRGDRERIIESLDLIREVLPISIGRMTEQVSLHLPHRLDEWITVLVALRSSLIWTTHYGINESIQDYSFELELWETLSKIEKVARVLPPILMDCTETYRNSTLLKGGSRSDHFIRLSAIMASSGMREEADRQLRYGIQSSLIYGYHKDITLFRLIDVLKIVNQRQEEKALEHSARILSMTDWMSHLTDGKETKWLQITTFKIVLQINRSAAFGLLQHYAKTIARWKMQDCLEEYILTAKEGDPYFLWSLSEMFANHFSEDGRYSHQMMKMRKHIVDIAAKSGSIQVQSYFEERFKNFILTVVPPRHWPDTIRQDHGYILQSKVKKDYNMGMEVKKEPSTFMVDGNNITEVELQKRCLLSFSEFVVTIKKVQDQNEHFYKKDLINYCLTHHIAEAKLHKDLIPLLSYLQSLDRWQDSGLINNLAQRFLAFGDHDNAILCFDLAYKTYGGSSRWNSNTEYLSAVAAIDKQRARKMVLEECYESTKGSAGGDETPALAAAGLNVLGEPDKLVHIFMDFLSHCESMFAQLPKDKDYSWLISYKEPLPDLERHILELVLDQLEVQEIDLGERLIKVLSELAIHKPNETLPVLLTRSVSCSGRARRRLLTILYCVTAHQPGLLVLHQESLAQLLLTEDFLCRQMVLRILMMIKALSPLKSTVFNVVEDIERGYSEKVYYPNFRLPTSPSQDFSRFVKRHTLYFFLKLIEQIEEIIQVPFGSLIAAIEQKLKAINWSADEELVRIRDDWDGHVHPQGWPVVWITTEFQELTMEMLWEILDEIAIKFKLNQRQIDWLWQLIQPADPASIFYSSSARPADIMPLTVQDKKEWLKELDLIEPLQIAVSIDKAEWITIYELRSMAEEEIFNVPYRNSHAVQTFLIPQKLYGSIERLEELDLWTEKILPNPAMSITVKQTETELKNRKRRIESQNDETLPLISTHNNPPLFLGHEKICSLASFILDEFNLTFEGLNLLQDERLVARYESWQEGYQDETYSREKLSSGFRFQIHRDLLTKICNRYQKIICICIDEEKEFYQSIYSKEPAESNSSRRYILHHF